jgi:hypothetical protein
MRLNKYITATYIRQCKYNRSVTIWDPIKEVVQQKYGEAARQARNGLKAGCGCGTSACCDADPITESTDVAETPSKVVSLSTRPTIRC